MRGPDSLPGPFGAGAEANVTGRTLTGAEGLVRTLVRSQVNVCFANPGTSEMHFVDALDRVDGMRCILGLFEGVVTGAADGYARMLDRPAATLLHLGPGLANGLSNLHNASRAHSPIVNVIGDHATYHRRYDAPLTSDIEGTARPFSDWVRTSPTAATVAGDGAAAVAAALSAPGRVASLILPADTAWSEVSAESIESQPAVAPSEFARPSEAAVEATGRILRGDAPTAILLGGRATREIPLNLVGRIAAATGASLFAATHAARIARGAGRVAVPKLPYPVGEAIDTLKGFSNIILVGAKPPTAFFAYPDRPSLLYQPGTTVHELAGAEDDIESALEALVELLGAREVVTPGAPAQAVKPVGSERLTPASVGAVLGGSLPEQAIVIDESITTGRTFLDATRDAPPHDWIGSTGGSIGYAMPNAIGASVACPGRKVIVLESDGSALYTPQSLWTMVHENLDVVVLIFANNEYRILRNEMKKVGADGAGPKASSLLDLTEPTMDWVKLAGGMGMEAIRAQSVEDLDAALAAAYAKTGPTLVEVML